MSTLTHDTTASGGCPETTSPQVTASGSLLSAGMVFAIISAISFGMAGALAGGLLDAGWSAGAVALARIGVGAVALTPFGLFALRGHWSQLRRHWRMVVAYGALAVAGAQFCYFSAIQHMEIGPALLIEYTAPAAVVGYLWIRFGERPGRLTMVGAGLAVLGLVLVLNLTSGAGLSPVGVAWALLAMIGLTAYFIINSHDDLELPPLALAWGGLMVGTLCLLALGIVGVLPMHASQVAPTYAGHAVAWWLPVLSLGVVPAAIAYVTGIASGRSLGSRVASFVALLEVITGVFWAWLLLAELPAAIQLVGGLLVLAGVVAVKHGESDGAPITTDTSEPVPG